jgi:hypothetical protein
MGLGGPGQPGRRGRGLGRAAGSAQSDRIVFFSNLFLMPETIPEIAEIVLKARKIL